MCQPSRLRVSLDFVNVQFKDTWHFQKKKLFGPIRNVPTELAGPLTHVSGPSGYKRIDRSKNSGTFKRTHVCSLPPPSAMPVSPSWSFGDYTSHLIYLPFQRSSRSSRPAPKPAAAPAQQSRGAHTAAMPPHAAHANPAHAPAPPTAATQSSQPGMFAQMAATAGSVAAGSVIGHGISNMLFGGSNAATTVEAAAPVQQQSFQSAPACDAQAKDFTRCLDKADLQSCSYYLDQLKAVCASLYSLYCMC